MLSFQADYVFPVNSPIIKNGVVTVDEAGKLIAVTLETEPRPESLLTKFHGIICPGFVNAHCQLELSHFKNKIDPGSGLVRSILRRNVLPSISETEIMVAASEADKEMFKNGIVAVGDLTISTVSRTIKSNSPIYYHNFIETKNFDPEKALATFSDALKLLNEFKNGSCSITPQAPYSVSKPLFKLIRDYCESGNNKISIDNQQSDEEDRFFRYKNGLFNDLYTALNIDISHFKPHARNSIQSINALLSNKQKIQLVYNTFTNLKDIYFLKRFDNDIRFCFCPNASLYTENKLPKIPLFLDQGFDLLLGTGSLYENARLSLLEEMKTIQLHYPDISTETLIGWGTSNGAKYFEIDNMIGSLEPGKTPGINLITDMDGLRLTAASTVRKLI